MWGASRRRRKPYSAHKTDRCARCGFVPEDSCQLDVDHLDRDHGNNDPANLQTLCANCHRLKTKRERIGTWISADALLDAEVVED
jgi:5-methylcytosine-specific restriction endonuclease McrA